MLGLLLRRSLCPWRVFRNEVRLNNCFRGCVSSSDRRSTLLGLLPIPGNASASSYAYSLSLELVAQLTNFGLRALRIGHCLFNFIEGELLVTRREVSR